jgi:hypothetical protein
VARGAGHRRNRQPLTQVSHHPPISACIAHSPSWEYYGEVDAKNRFGGKSFEIKPTGIAHVNLRITKAWGPDAPAAPAMFPNIVSIPSFWSELPSRVFWQTLFPFGELAPRADALARRALGRPAPCAVAAPRPVALVLSQRWSRRRYAQQTRCE